MFDTIIMNDWCIPLLYLAPMAVTIIDICATCQPCNRNHKCDAYNYPPPNQVPPDAHLVNDVGIEGIL